MCQKDAGLGLDKLHCQCCVYLDAFLNKNAKVAVIAYTTSINNVIELPAFLKILFDIGYIILLEM